LEQKEIKLIIDLMQKNGLTEFELEKGDFKLRLKKGHAQGIPAYAPAPVYLPPAPSPAPAAASHTPAASAGSDLPAISSPMVGTLYLAPSPDSPNYVSVGSVITPDTVVCIIEAMKVMNEIKAETKGTIVEILVENGKPVEFGKPLFRVKP
jgi:acetyl-CoA carboxylase biotin carboxyl carrier protein